MAYSSWQMEGIYTLLAIGYMLLAQLTFLYTPKVDYCMVMAVIFNIVHWLKA